MAQPAAPITPVLALVDDPDRYELIGEHARGGLGRVVRAVDKRLGRTVAVKELLRHNDAANEARFMREALITARLEHPGIVPVHEAGRWPNGEPYYVMKLVEGRTLKELIVEHANVRDRLALIPHVIAVADAVGYAHSEDVIHRDLKPSNVIIGEFGETIVVDWGLARDRKQDLPEPEGTATISGSGLSTVSGKVIGTPAYMAPEQARGELVDERADVYAIGALLYEVLAGAAPHADTTPQATLDRVLAGPPRPLCEAMPHVPSELATIVAKAMSREPAARYANATALAEDLRRFQTGKLVRAHSYTALSRLKKKLGQHRGVAAVAIASVVALGGVGVASFRRVVAERNIATVERQRSEVALASTEQRRRALVLLQAETSLRKDPTATLAWLKLSLAGDDTGEDRGKLVDLVDEAVAQGVSRHVFRPGDWVFDAQFTPDGKTVIATVRDGSLRSYDLATGTETTLGRIAAAAEVLAMTPDGETAITGSMTGEIHAWSIHGGGGPRHLATVASMIQRLTISPDGRRIRVDNESGVPSVLDLAHPLVPGEPVPTVEPSPCGPKTSLRVAVAESDWTKQVEMTAWNQITAVDGERSTVLGQIDKAITFVALAPRGDLAVIHDGTTLWSVPFAGGPMRAIGKYEGKLVATEWSPDQKTIAVIGNRPDILLADVETGTTRELRGHTDALYNVQWTRDGKRLLSGSDDGTARVWTIADGSSLLLRGHDDDVYRARFSADETQVATASLDGTVRVWSLAQPGTRALVEGSGIEQLAIANDAALVKTATTVSRWNLATGARDPLWAWAADPHSLGVGVASPDGNTLLIPHSDWTVEVRRHDHPTIVLHGHREAISHVEFTRDSKVLYSSSYDGTLRRWDLATGEGKVVIDGATPIRGFAVAADGRVAVQMGDAVSLVAPDGAVRVLGKGDKWCSYFAQFEPVRDRLVVYHCDRAISVIDGEHIIDLPTDGYSASNVALSADGAFYAGSMGDRTVRVWDGATGRVLHVLRGHTDLVMWVAISPDNKLVASASYDKTVRVWDLATGQHRVLRGHTGAVDRLAWHGNTELVTGSRDGTVRVWQVPQLALPSARDLADRLDTATSARIDADRPATGNL